MKMPPIALLLAICLSISARAELVYQPRATDTENPKAWGQASSSMLQVFAICYAIAAWAEDPDAVRSGDPSPNLKPALAKCRKHFESLSKNHAEMQKAVRGYLQTGEAVASGPDEKEEKRNEERRLVIARLERERRTYYEAYGASPPTVRAQAAMIALDQLKLIEDCWDEQGVEIIATKEAARLHPLMKLVNRAHALGTLVSWDMQKR